LHWVRKKSRSSRRGPRLGHGDSIWSGTFGFERASPAPGVPTRLGTECQIDTRLVAWWASRVETARISLKRMRRFRLAPRVGQNGTRPGFRAIQHGECALGALEGRFWLLGRDVAGASEAAPLLRAFAQVPWKRAACAMANFHGGGRCLPPPPQTPMGRDQSVCAQISLGESGWADRVARAPQICTNPRGRRFRHFGGRATGSPPAGSDGQWTPAGLAPTAS
jgi:hypothetical protein